MLHAVGSIGALLFGWQCVRCRKFEKNCSPIVRQPNLVVPDFAGQRAVTVCACDFLAEDRATRIAPCDHGWARSSAAVRAIPCGASYASQFSSAERRPLSQRNRPGRCRSRRAALTAGVPGGSERIQTGRFNPRSEARTSAPRSFDNGVRTDLCRATGMRQGLGRQRERRTFQRRRFRDDARSSQEIVNCRETVAAAHGGEESEEKDHGKRIRPDNYGPGDDPIGTPDPVRVRAAAAAPTNSGT